MPDAHVTFDDLPPDGRGKTKIRAAVDQLKAKPGAWACISQKPNPKAAKSLAQRARRGVGSFQPEGAFEAQVRGTEVWARYVGEEDQDQDVAS